MSFTQFVKREVLETMYEDLRAELANVKSLFLRTDISRDELRLENQQLLYKIQELEALNDELRTLAEC